ncbi:MAG: isoprenylcysteine carboxylmethyltransferase family protein [Thermodesulfobacteriota bacterium]
MVFPPTPQRIPLSAEANKAIPTRAGGGSWLRRYRRVFPIPLCIMALAFLRPGMPWDSPVLDTLLDVVGVGCCCLGQGLRMWAWGSNATVGKHGVRIRGPYMLMRHPLYAGNFLILLGLVIIFHNPIAYPLFLLPFAYLYHVITDLEEARMYRRFGTDYQEYRVREVPRFWPAVGNLRAALRSTLPFSWGFAWRKEYESCCGWLAGAVALEVYEGVLLRGWAQNWPYTVQGLLALGVIGILALVGKLRKDLNKR